MDNFPAIGEIVLDPNDKFIGADGKPKYDLLLCDGSRVNAETHPLLNAKLGGSGGWGYTGDELSRAGIDSYISGICFDGTFYWMRSRTSTLVHQFDADFVSTGVSFPMSDTQDGDSLVWTGSHLAVNNRSTMYFYDTDGNIVDSFTVEKRFSNFCLDLSGNTMWLDETGGSTIDEVTMDGVYTGRKITNIAIGAMAFDLDGTLFGGDFQSNQINRYDGVTGAFIEDIVNTLPQGVQMLDFHRMDDGSLWVCGGSLSNRYAPLSALLPDMTSPDPACPYRIVADLTGGA